MALIVSNEGKISRAGQGQENPKIMGGGKPGGGGGKGMKNTGGGDKTFF